MFNLCCALAALGAAVLLGQSGFGQSASGGLQRSAPAQVSSSLAGAFRGG